MKTIKLGELCDINPKAPYLDKGTLVSFIPMQRVSEKGQVDTSETRLSEEVIKGFSSFREGDILMAKITPCMENGKGGIARGLCNGIGYGSTEFHVIRPISPQVRAEWIYYYTVYPRFRKLCEENMTGSAGQKRVPKSYLLGCSVPVPDLNTQDNVIHSLHTLRSIIELRSTQLAKLDELVKCRFVELFGEPVSNSKQWPKQDLASYIDFITSGSRGWSKFFSNKGKYFITIKNVKGGKVSTSSVRYVNPPNNAEAIRTKLKEGDLLISITADLGRTGVVSKEIADYGAYINQHLTCIRLKLETLHPIYTAYFLETEAGKLQFSSKNQNAVKAGLNFDSIKSLQILIPPLSKQEAFVTFVHHIDKLRFAE